MQLKGLEYAGRWRVAEGEGLGRASELRCLKDLRRRCRSSHLKEVRFCGGRGNTWTERTGSAKAL